MTHCGGSAEEAKRVGEEVSDDADPKIALPQEEQRQDESRHGSKDDLRRTPTARMGGREDHERNQRCEPFQSGRGLELSNQDRAKNDLLGDAGSGREEE